MLRRPDMLAFSLASSDRRGWLFDWHCNNVICQHEAPRWSALLFFACLRNMHRENAKKMAFLEDCTTRQCVKLEHCLDTIIFLDSCWLLSVLCHQSYVSYVGERLRVRRRSNISRTVRRAIEMCCAKKLLLAFLGDCTIRQCVKLEHCWTQFNCNHLYCLRADEFSRVAVLEALLDDRAEVRQQAFLAFRAHFTRFE